MIISASRRTDIPAFYSEWLMRRIRAGYCTVTNPFNQQQASRISLLPEDVDAMVFWTRNPLPMLPYLAELDALGYRYYFQVTLLDYSRSLEPSTPLVDTAIRSFRQLSDAVGAQRVIWRYDPIFLSDATGVDYHRRAFERISMALQCATRRCVVSILDPYPKAARRMAVAAELGCNPLPEDEMPAALDGLMPEIAAMASAAGMEVKSCAEELDLARYGVLSGKCIDDDLIREVFGMTLEVKKDPYQRKACSCAVSKDVGAYDTCLYGCAYCYATGSFERARRRHGRHDPQGDSLIVNQTSPSAGNTTVR